MGADHAPRLLLITDPIFSAFGEQVFVGVEQSAVTAIPFTSTPDLSADAGAFETMRFKTADFPDGLPRGEFIVRGGVRYIVSDSPRRFEDDGTFVVTISKRGGQ